VNNSQIIRKHFPYLLSIIAIILFIIYLIRNADRYQEILYITPRLLLILLGLIIIVIVGNGLTNFFFYRGLGIIVSLNEGLGLAAVNTLANQLPFSGGMIAKGAYLNTRYRLEYGRYFSATAALYVLYVSFSGVLGAVTLLYKLLFQRITAPTILIAGFVGMISSIGLYWLPIELKWFPDRLKEYIENLLDGWQILRRNKKLVIQLIVVQLIALVAMAGRYWIVFRILAQEVNLSSCILFSAAAILTQLITITPGGLGVREAIVAGVASILGFDFGLGVVAVGIDRLVATTIILILGTFYTYVLSREATRDN
jgi:uncharacterized membrane protein YbhN (UPF0104 family)